MIFRWTNSADASAVIILANVCVSVKAYTGFMTRIFQPAKVIVNLASPLVKIADAVRCDFEPLLYFRKAVAAYL